MEESTTSSRSKTRASSPHTKPATSEYSSSVPGIFAIQTLAGLGKRTELLGYILGALIIVVGFGALLAAINNSDSAILSILGFLSLGIGASIGVGLVALGRFIQWISERY